MILLSFVGTVQGQSLEANRYHKMFDFISFQYRAREV